MTSRSMVVVKVSPSEKKPAEKPGPAWFVFYTLPRAEKMALHDLLKHDYDAFLPTTKSLKLWKNRQKKWIEEVLFPNYVFVNTHDAELYNIVSMPKIVTCVRCGVKPCNICNKEIEAIKRMLSDEQNVWVEQDLFCEGVKVRVIKGPLTGCEGILVKQRGKTRFGVQVINHTVLVDINIAMLEKL
jgi:transcription antitermination factor NusG